MRFLRGLFVIGETLLGMFAILIGAILLVMPYYFYSEGGSAWHLLWYPAVALPFAAWKIGE